MPTVRFGVAVPIFANPGLRLFRTPNYAELDAATTMRYARRADELGYDSLWVADHLMLGKDDAILEGWTVISALAGSTQRARLGMIHQAHFFRNPALAAKMAATLDQISGGRLIHFYDVAFQKREHVVYDFYWNDDQDDRAARMVEGLDLIRALWATREPVTFDGTYYRVTEATCNPGPAQRPHPPIWLGETNPRLLRACAEHGQGWNTTPVNLDELRRRLGLLRAACDEVGRDYDEIEKSLEIQVLIGRDRDDIRAQLRRIVELGGGEASPEMRAFVAGQSDQTPPEMANSTIYGTQDEVSRQIEAYIAAGISHFLLWFVDAPEQAGLERFASEVAPRFRAEVATARTP